MNRKLVLAVAFIVISEGAIAGTYNYRSILPGERAVGLGGAYTALSETGEGGYYNPAGLAFADKDSLSIAGNFYRFTRGTRKDALTFAGATSDISQNSMTGIPQVASFAKRVRFPWDAADDHPMNTIALNVVMTEQTDISDQVRFTVPSGQAAGTRSIKETVLYVGPSLARRWNERFSWGISLFYVLDQRESIGFLLEDDPNILGQGFLQRKDTIGNLLGIVGLRYAPAENLWLGVTYQTPSFRLHRDGLRFSSTITVDPTTSAVSKTTNDFPGTSPREDIPQKFVVGLAYVRPKNWAVSADVLFHLPQTFETDVGGGAAKIDQQFVTNFSVGGEYYVNEHFPVRLGVFSNFSSAPDIQAGVAGQPDKVDHVGTAITVGFERENTTASIGMIVTLGSGDGVDNLGTKIPVSINTYTTVLAGSYKF